MKYIRTKDGRIIPFLDEDRETKLPKRDLRFYYIQPNNVITFICKKDILKQADTIEELCDGYIVELPMRHFHFYFEKTRNCFAFRNAMDEYNEWKDTKSDMSIEKKRAKELVYLWGVIWTKGANGQPVSKCVAKLNDDTGELELL